MANGTFYAETQATSSPLAGVLYAEDFDEQEAAPAFSGDAGAARAPAPLTASDVERACAAAVETARAEWEALLDQRRTQELGAIAAALAAAQAEREEQSADLAEATVSTMLAMLSTALPHLCRAHGPAEVRAVIQHLLPAMRQESRLLIRVAPDLAPTIREDLALLDDQLTRSVEITAAPIPAGDVRITWAEGAYTRDTAKILSAMQDALAQLGLTAPVEPILERRMQRAG